VERLRNSKQLFCYLRLSPTIPCKMGEAKNSFASRTVTVSEKQNILSPTGMTQTGEANVARTSLNSAPCYRRDRGPDNDSDGSLLTAAPAVGASLAPATWAGPADTARRGGAPRRSRGAARMEGDGEGARCRSADGSRASSSVDGAARPRAKRKGHDAHGRTTTLANLASSSADDAMRPRAKRKGRRLSSSPPPSLLRVVMREEEEGTELLAAELLAATSTRRGGAEEIHGGAEAAAVEDQRSSRGADSTPQTPIQAPPTPIRASPAWRRRSSAPSPVPAAGALLPSPPTPASSASGAASWQALCPSATRRTATPTARALLPVLRFPPARTGFLPSRREGMQFCIPSLLHRHFASPVASSVGGDSGHAQ
jgi:hypothetical protein